MTENEGEEDDELITWEDLVKCNSFLNNFSCFDLLIDSRLSLMQHPGQDSIKTHFTMKMREPSFAKKLSSNLSTPESVITHKIEVIYHGQFNIHQLGNKLKIILCILSCGLLGLNLKKSLCYEHSLRLLFKPLI